MTSVLTLGLAAVDFVFHVDGFPTNAEKYRARDAITVGGGCAANSAVAISKLGGEAVLVARVGDDHIASLVRAQLAAEGVSTDFVHRSPGGRSAFSSVLVNPAGERQIVNFRGQGLSQETNWLYQVPLVDSILVDTRWKAGAIVALETARDRGIPGVVDAEAPIDPTVLSVASHVAFSRQGLISLYPEQSLEMALGKVNTDVPCWVCATDGANGVYYIDGSGIGHAPAAPVKATDTLGAGDVWHGAFALRLGEGATEMEAILFANAAATLKCMNSFGPAGYPDRKTTENFQAERTT